MLRQLEGSQAVAESGRAVPPRGDLRVPDLAADPHRRGALRPRADGRARAVRVPHGRVGVRRACRRDRRLGHRRARLHGDREPGAALHGRGALQRLGPRAADRDDGREPCDRRADQHLERPHATRCRSATRAGSSSTPSRTRRRSTCTSRRSGWPRSSRMPVMVCMDGFILTHAVEQVDIPNQEQVDAFLPAFEPRQLLDPDDPMTIGAMVGPEAFTEVKYLMHAKQMQALDVIPELAGEFEQAFGRSSGGLVRPYRTDDAETSSSRSDRCSARSRRSSTRCASEGVKIGALGIKCFRPWPARRGPRRARRAPARSSCVEKAFAVGARRDRSGRTCGWLSASTLTVYDVVAGLGGRPITKSSLPSAARQTCSTATARALAAALPRPRPRARRARAAPAPRAPARPGPHAENMLRDLGAVAAGRH